MAKASKIKVLSFILPDRVGLLAEVSAALAGAKVNISGICAYGMEKQACFLALTDSNAKAKKALAGLGITAQEEEMVGVEMPNRAGELQKTAKRIAEAGVNIDYMFGTAGAGKTGLCIFKTADDKKAIRVINK